MNDNFVEQIPPRNVKVMGDYDVFVTRVDDVSTTSVTYVGKASMGASPSSAVWQIMKIDESGSPVTTVITWADSNANFDNIWDNRTSITFG